ncbi:MAG: flagellar biosynthetic protein FliO [Phycisphaerales bacterium]
MIAQATVFGSMLSLQEAAGAAPAIPSFGQALLRMVVSLAIVLGVLVVVLFLLKRRMRGGGLGKSGEMKVLDSFAITPGQRIVLVRVRDRTLLLGATDSQISRLAEFGAEPETKPVTGFREAWEASANETPKPAPRREESITP